MSVAAAIDRFDIKGNGSFPGWLNRITRKATIDRLATVQSRREMISGSGVARRMDAVHFNAKLKSIQLTLDLLELQLHGTVTTIATD